MASWLARKRPREDEMALPPLQSCVYPPIQRLPTLSQMLRPSIQFNSMVPTPSSQTPTTTMQELAVVSALEDDEQVEDKAPWPTADEYYELLTTHKATIPVYDLGVDPRGVPLQPEFIYNEPRSCMYFLKCSQLLGRGSFGFPRKKKTTVATKNAKGVVGFVRRGDATKGFEWRKMSFVTGLPKKQPLVRYITATCYSKTHRSALEKKKVMRMHAVMLASADGSGECGDYVLVHIRAGGSKRVGVRTTVTRDQQQQFPSSSTTPVSSPTHSDVSPPQHSSSIHSLLTACDHVVRVSPERPVTPLLHAYYPVDGGSASPPVKRRRPSEPLPSISVTRPRSIPLWLSPLL